MQANAATYVMGGRTPRSLGQMIRDQEARQTIRNLNPEGPKPRERSFVERYRDLAHASGVAPTDRN